MFNYLKKTIVWILLFVLFVFSAFWFADDCSSTEIIFHENRIFWQEDIELARSHLQYHCCLHRQWKKDNPFVEKDYQSDGLCSNSLQWPSSPYWYDHLIDIGIRKLSAKEEDLYGEMEPDKDGKEWLDFIYNTEEKKTPELISQKYEEFWAQKLPIPNVIRKENIPVYFDAFEKTLDINLQHKYINLCLVSLHMYEKSGLKNVDILWDWYYSKCMYLVRSKINQERVVAVTLSQNAWANLLFDSWTSYTNQFIQNRLMKLQDKIIAISSLFNTIGKQAPLSKECMQ